MKVSLKNKTINTIQHFVNAPDLKINSEEYLFEKFQFLDEEISESKFQFPKNIVLGMQAESCFQAYLKQSKNFELLAANLQINGEKETLGELDYIVRNLQTEKIIHIELACKFYLYDENLGNQEEQKWVGPNRKDTLFDKLEKVRLKQFPLLQKNETIEKLKALEIEIPTEQQLCLKAFLFIPKKMNSASFQKNLSDCIVGYYIKPEDFEEEDKNARFAIPTKKEWLLPLETIETWHSFSEVKQLITEQIQNKRAPLIYKKTPQSLERFFVVWW